MLRALIALALLLSCASLAMAGGSVSNGPRIKDLVEFEGVRGNDLVGYGLVVGLSGTGDGIRNSPFTEEALSNLLERLGVNVSGERFRPKNVAAVIVTATLPPFARAGSRVDVTVSAIGDAKNLLGGTLIMTPLNAADGEIYAVAQGPILAGGVKVEGDGGGEQIGVPTSGSIPGGARIEREVPFSLNDLERVRLALRDPDFTTAARIEAAINGALGRPVAVMSDSGTVTLDLVQAGRPTANLIAAIENIEVEPSMKARVVVDQRSGTIVLGSDVRISRVAISQGNLTIPGQRVAAHLAAQPVRRGGDPGRAAHRNRDRPGRPEPHGRGRGERHARRSGRRPERAGRGSPRHDRHPEVDQGHRRFACRAVGSVTPVEVRTGISAHSLDPGNRRPYQPDHAIGK